MTYVKSPLFVRNLIDSIIEIEGGYVNNPNDSGGATNYGITEEVAREAGYYGDMRDFPKTSAQDIYAKRYFYEPNLHLIYSVDDLIASEVFDSGVNVGTYRAVIWLQKSLNALNNQQKYYSDLRVDGLIGAKTVTALESYLDRRGREGVAVMLKALNAYQGAFYLDLAERREKDETFIYGWLKERVLF
jgi:lysozyme family protein